MQEVSKQDSKDIGDANNLQQGMNENRTNIIIPQCCREGWDSCKHVIHPQPKEKQNIGM